MEKVSISTYNSDDVSVNEATYPKDVDALIIDVKNLG